MGGFLSKFQSTCSNDLSDDDRTADPTSFDQGLHLPPKTKKSEDEKPDFYSIFLAETLNSFRQQNRFADFTIIVDGNRFPAHKNVLAASCKFFKDLLNETEDICYEMENVDPFALEEVLNFLYIGKCSLHELNVASVLRVARILGLHDLQEASERCLSQAECASGREHTSVEGNFFVSSKDSILTAIRKFQIEGSFCDVTLTTSCGRVIPVHKNILAAVSCYFQGLFRSEMKEAHESNIDFSMVDKGVVSELLNFIYSGNISITFDNIRSLLQACDYLLMESLKTTIASFLKGSLTLCNFWHLFPLVKSFEGLKEISISQMVCTNYYEVAKSDEFLELTEEDMRFFLTNDDIVSSEAQMLESLIRWYKYSKKQREESFKSLLHLIHMPSIPDLYLKFLAEKEGVDELRSYTGHRLREKVPLDELKKTAHLYNLALFGFTRDPDCPGNQLFYWLPFAGPWSYITSVGRCPINWCGGHPFIFHDNVLYLQVYDQIQLAFFRSPLSARQFENSFLDPVTFTESLSTETEDCAAVALAGCIYLIGGNFRNEALSTVQQYNIATQLWERVSSMQEGRYYHSAVNYRDRYIYVFGGIEGFGCINRIYKSTVERYDPEKNCWSYVASMHQPRCNGLACVLTHKIFVIGGEIGECGGPPKCEIYDPLTDEWQMGSFQIKESATLHFNPDTGTFRRQMFHNDSNEDDPLEPKVCHEAYHFHFVYKPSVTCCNGRIIVFDFGSYWITGVRLPVYFVDPKTGNFRILYSLPSRFGDVSRGVIMPLSRRDMIKALKDYPGNKPVQ